MAIAVFLDHADEVSHWPWRLGQPTVAQPKGQLP